MDRTGIVRSRSGTAAIGSTSGDAGYYPPSPDPTRRRIPRGGRRGRSACVITRWKHLVRSLSATGRSLARFLGRLRRIPHQQQTAARRARAAAAADAWRQSGFIVAVTCVASLRVFCAGQRRSGWWATGTWRVNRCPRGFTAERTDRWTTDR